MKYKALLQKYIKHVGDCDGDFFLDPPYEKEFIKEEWETLSLLKDEILKQNQTIHIEVGEPVILFPALAPPSVSPLPTRSPKPSDTKSLSFFAKG